MPNCPSCGDPAVLPSGLKSAEVLMISEFPNKQDMQKGIPFATHPMFATAGKVLRTEMGSVGIDYNLLRVANIWLHEPNDNDNCFQVGYDLVLDEAKGRKAILLVGSLAVETFTKYKVSDVCGLQVDSPILSCPIIYAMTNPANVFRVGAGVGEIRLALKKFANHLEKEGIV